LGSEAEGGTAGGTGRATGALLDTAPSPLPARVDHRSQYLDGCLTVSNQHACGWCTVHAATATLEALHCSKGCDVPELSEAHLRNNSVEIGGGSFGSCSRGWNTDEALETLVRDPIVDNEAWPYVANGRGLNEGRPTDAVLAMAGHQPTGSHAVDLSNLTAVKQELASEREVIISIPVYYDNPNAAMPPMGRDDWGSGSANVRVPPTAAPCGCNDGACTDPMCLGGYHAVVLTGYDDSTMQFQFLNSWGKDWGQGGYGTIDYALVTAEGYSGAALDDVNTDIPNNACEDDTDAGTDAGPSDGGMPTDGGMPSDAAMPDGGVMPVPGDPCSTTAGCAACTTLSGCGWCEGTGCRADSSAASCTTTFHTSTCPAAGDPCRTNGSCGDCVGADGCVWCADSSVCYSPSLRTESCGDPRNAADQCSDCGVAADCAACTGTEGCGWCPGSSVGVVAPGTTTGDCILGSETAPDRASCAAYRGTEAECNSDECSLITDCGDCTSTENCGWCDGTDQCMLGGFFGPVTDERFGSSCGEDWDYFGFACDNTDGSCGGAAQCRECLRSGVGCEWDDTNSMCNPPMMSMGGMVFTDDADCPGPCQGRFAMCDTSEECCEGLTCVNNDCVDCGGAGGLEESCDPTTTNACCGTLVCSRAAGGGSTCCKSDTDQCTGDGECCGDMTCVAGECECRATGESCQAGRECCGASFCDAGTCT
jgi:hypothetical protein